MTAFAVRRLALAIPTLLGITLLTFVLMRLAPGDPASALLADEAGLSRSEYASLRQAYRVDQPVPVQYLRWLGNVLSGDLGHSTVTNRPVGELVADALPNTLELSVVSLGVALALGVPLGIVAARASGTWLDHLMRIVSVAGHAIPSFWVALIFILLFSVQWRLFPSGGASSLGSSPFDVGDRLHHLVGPVLALSLGGIANYSRYVRTELLEVLGQEYLRTARAKGLRESSVLLRHALRTALIPLITALGGVLANLTSGALIVEQIFAWPGMGRLAYDAARARDAPVVLACVLLVSGLLVVSFLLRDLAYGLADPRARASA